QQLEELRAGLGGEATEAQALDLALDGRDVVGMAVADAAHRDAGHQVDVLVAVLVDERAAAAVRHREPRVLREPLVAGSDVPTLAGDDVARARPDFAPLRHRTRPTRRAMCAAMTSDASSRNRAKLGQAFR